MYVHRRLRPERHACPGVTVLADDIVLMERDVARAEVADLLDALEDVINQACTDRETGILDSMALSAYAHGMRTLAAHGHLVIEHEVGRRVIGHWPEQEAP